jgi:hypothetical protein
MDRPRRREQANGTEMRVPIREWTRAGETNDIYLDDPREPEWRPPLVVRFNPSLPRDIRQLDRYTLILHVTEYVGQDDAMLNHVPVAYRILAVDSEGRRHYVSDEHIYRQKALCCQNTNPGGNLVETFDMRLQPGVYYWMVQLRPWGYALATERSETFTVRPNVDPGPANGVNGQENNQANGHR